MLAEAEAPDEVVEGEERRLHALPEHLVEDTLGHHRPPAAKDGLEEGVIRSDAAFHAEFGHPPEDLDGLLGNPGEAVPLDQRRENPLAGLQAAFRHVVEDEAARVVEHPMPGEETDDLAVGDGVVPEARLFHPAEEAEGVVGLSSPTNHREDELLIEGRAEGPDRVLEASSPGSLRHHVAYCLVQRRRCLHWAAPRPPLLPRRSQLRSAAGGEIRRPIRRSGGLAIEGLGGAEPVEDPRGEAGVRWPSKRSEGHLQGSAAGDEDGGGRHLGSPAAAGWMPPLGY